MAGTLAIDLGSTSTVVAWQGRGEEPTLLPLPPYSSDAPCMVPSLLWLASPDQPHPLLGRQVIEAGLAERSSPQLCRDFKRWIGNPGASAAAGEPCWLTPEQAGTRLLLQLWQALPAGLQPERLVLTAPIETYRGYRLWLQQLSRQLPVPELAVVDEPTAAAIGSGLPPGSRVLVVDLGGGTIDLSLVALEGGEGRAAPIAQLLRFAGRDLDQSGQSLRCARVIGKAGLPLGGRDIDRWIAAELLPGQPLEEGLLQASERLKRQLSETPDALQLWTPPGGPARELRLERRRLEQLLKERGLLEQLDVLLEAVLAAARRQGLGLGDIDAVLPVGGGSHMPLIRQWLEQRCAPVRLRGERPVAAVALGALALTPNVRLQDVLSRGVSLRCWDRRRERHHWHPLFVAGQSWPTEQPLELVLACSEDGQRELELVLGEPRLEQRSEVVFEAGLPVLRAQPAGEPAVAPWPAGPTPLALASPGQSGVDRLRLRFRIDSEGQLRVGGHDLGTGADLPERRLGPVR
jgi:molecular chaperone DnaK (HSP70)